MVDEFEVTWGVGEQIAGHGLPDPALRIGELRPAAGGNAGLFANGVPLRGVDEGFGGGEVAASGVIDRGAVAVDVFCELGQDPQDGGVGWGRREELDDVGEGFCQPRVSVIGEEGLNRGGGAGDEQRGAGHCSEDVDMKTGRRAQPDGPVDPQCAWYRVLPSLDIGLVEFRSLGRGEASPAEPFGWSQVWVSELDQPGDQFRCRASDPGRQCRRALTDVGEGIGVEGVAVVEDLRCPIEQGLGRLGVPEAICSRNERGFGRLTSTATSSTRRSAATRAAHASLEVRFFSRDCACKVSCGTVVVGAARRSVPQSWRCFPGASLTSVAHTHPSRRALIR